MYALSHPLPTLSVKTRLQAPRRRGRGYRVGVAIAWAWLVGRDVRCPCEERSTSLGWRSAILEREPATLSFVRVRGPDLRHRTENRVLFLSPSDLCDCVMNVSKTTNNRITRCVIVIIADSDHDQTFPWKLLAAVSRAGLTVLLLRGLRQRGIYLQYANYEMCL